MRFLLGLLLLAASMGNACAGDSRMPDLLIYISPQQYIHEAHVSFRARFSLWVMLGPKLEKSAVALKPYFREMAMCEGGKDADVVVSLKPQLAYNPVDGYHAKVSADFFLGNGKRVGNVTATAIRRGWMGSVFAEDDVQQAFDMAMQEIARLYAGDAKLAEAIRIGMEKETGRVPCAVSVLLPSS